MKTKLELFITEQKSIFKSWKKKNKKKQTNKKSVTFHNWIIQKNWEF